MGFCIGFADNGAASTGRYWGDCSIVKDVFRVRWTNERKDM